MEAKSCGGELNRPDRGYISLTEVTSFEMRQNSTEGFYNDRKKSKSLGRMLHSPE